jgi:protein-S-isoprenylcysteine O-methyltransferase Ste14
MIRTRIPPPVYALCTAGLIWLLNRCVPSLRWINAPWNELGWGLIAIGLGVDFAAVVSFIRTRTTINPMRPDRIRHLVTSGLYRLSRNPMYLGLVLSLSGWAWLLGSPIGLIVIWLFARVLVIVQIAPEEAALREKFGEAYLAYSKRVNRWIGRNDRPLPSSASR